MSNYLLWQCENRAQRSNVKSYAGGRASSPTLPQCQLGDCQVHFALHAGLSVLSTLLNDIGLNLVHFAVQFSKFSLSRCAGLEILDNGHRRT